jgi:hypothetical protein
VSDGRGPTSIAAVNSDERDLRVRLAAGEAARALWGEGKKPFRFRQTASPHWIGPDIPELPPPEPPCIFGSPPLTPTEAPFPSPTSQTLPLLRADPDPGTPLPAAAPLSLLSVDILAILDWRRSVPHQRRLLVSFGY